MESGVDCTFGIPGDFALPLYAAQEAAGLRTIVCTHEPSAAFAADAYARIRGLGVVMTTYGAGALNMVNPIAAAYAEHSPVLVISGAPALEARKAGFVLHHTVKDFDGQRRIYAEITAATAALNDPATALTELDRVLDTILREQRPGYVEIPRDLTDAPAAPSMYSPGPAGAATDAAAIAEAAAEIAELLARARRCVLFTGIGIARRRLETETIHLAERWGLPVVSSVLGKSVFPESHPNYVGVFVGTVGDDAPRLAFDEADLILAVGVLDTDVNAGFRTYPPPRSKLIALDDTRVRVLHHHYERAPLGDMVRALLARAPASPRPFWTPSPSTPESPTPGPSPESHVTMEGVIASLRTLDSSRYTLVADIGDAWFTALETRAERYLALGFYATMGFAVPGALGAAVADPDRRPLVLVGDGAFQMTGAEIATMAGIGAPATIVVLDNANYKMLEVFDRSRPYYELRPWDYVGYAGALGVPGEMVETRRALETALARAERVNGPYLIHVRLDPHDHAPITRRLRAGTERSASGGSA